MLYSTNQFTASRSHIVRKYVLFGKGFAVKGCLAALSVLKLECVCVFMKPCEMTQGAVGSNV